MIHFSAEHLAQCSVWNSSSSSEVRRQIHCFQVILIFNNARLILFFLALERDSSTGGVTSVLLSYLWFSLLIYYLLFICWLIDWFVLGKHNVTTLVYRSNDHIYESESVLSSSHVSPRNWTQIIGFNGNCLSLLCRLLNPHCYISLRFY